jgi:hypothetical protein
MLVACHNELRATFDRGFDIFVIVRICGNRMDA